MSSGLLAIHIEVLVGGRCSNLWPGHPSPLTAETRVQDWGREEKMRSWPFPEDSVWVLWPRSLRVPPVLWGRLTLWDLFLLVRLNRPSNGLVKIAEWLIYGKYRLVQYGRRKKRLKREIMEKKSKYIFLQFLFYFSEDQTTTFLLYFLNRYQETF